MKAKIIRLISTTRRVSISVITLCILSGGGLFAQSLDFNQVLLISTTEDTVPAGKVWKVEGYWQAHTSHTYQTETGTCTYNWRHHPYYLNGAPMWKYDGSPGTGSGTVYMAVGNQFPFWLPAGSRLKTICPDDYISVMEFNVGP